MNKGKMICGLLAASLLASFYACSDDETYAEQKERERKAISSFLSRNVSFTLEGDTYNVGNINIISEEQFEAQDSTTDLTKNEYVYISSNGLYLQIVDKGAGEPLKSGKSATIYSRFIEYNIMGDSVQLSNRYNVWATMPDVFTCKNNYGTYTASFTSGLMYSSYGSSVPSGWLYPLRYVNIGKPDETHPSVAKVRIIVPHSEGHQYATSNVYPCFYELTYQQGY